LGGFPPKRCPSPSLFRPIFFFPQEGKVFFRGFLSKPPLGDFTPRGALFWGGFWGPKFPPKTPLGGLFLGRDFFPAGISLYKKSLNWPKTPFSPNPQLFLGPGKPVSPGIIGKEARVFLKVLANYLPTSFKKD